MCTRNKKRIFANFDINRTIPKWTKVKPVLLYMIPGIFWFFSGIFLVTLIELGFTWVFDLLGNHNPSKSASSTEVFSYTKYINLVLVYFIYFKFVTYASPDENDDHGRKDRDDSGSPSYSDSVSSGTDHIFY